MRRELIPAAILAIGAQALGLVNPVRAATPIDVPFAYTGAEQTWLVPPRVTTIHVALTGAAGGNAGSATGGTAHTVRGDVSVTPGTNLFVEVGGNGVTASSTAGGGGFNGGGNSSPGTRGGGGGGGGATDIRTATRTSPSTLTSRLMVAAGGGGAGSFSNGGSAGNDGATSGNGESGGAAGTSNGGGAGGGGDAAGTGGGLGQGGNGAPAGGGGGGGLYGGGGGGNAISIGGAGGGGGSDFAGTATNVSITGPTGGPSVLITYTPRALINGGAVDATVTMAESVVCLELSTNAIDFGTRQFGDVGVAASPGITTSNCGAVSESVFARGTDATGGGPTTWTLNDTGSCAGGTLPVDNYELTIERQDTSARVRLSTSNKALETLAGTSTIDNLARIDTPCPGGSGAGVVMSMQITFVATESAP